MGEDISNYIIDVDLIKLLEESEAERKPFVLPDGMTYTALLPGVMATLRTGFVPPEPVEPETIERPGRSILRRVG